MTKMAKEQGASVICSKSLRFIAYVLLSAFVPAKALKFVIGASKLKDNCMLDDTRLIIAEMNTIWSELVQIAGGY